MTPFDRVMFEDLFAEDALTPIQFFGRSGSERVRRTGECQLLAALLADAIRCYQRNYFAVSRSRKRLFREAEQWLMEPAPSDGSGPAFSFHYVCDVLGIEPETIRNALRRWSETQCMSAPRRLPAPAASGRVRPRRGSRQRAAS